MRIDLGCGERKKRVAYVDSWSVGRGWKDLDTTIITSSCCSASGPNVYLTTGFLFLCLLQLARDWRVRRLLLLRRRRRRSGVLFKE